MKARLWALIRPFRGCDVRRLVAALTLAVALPRLPIFPMSASMVVYPLGILPQETFGWLFLVVGVALLATCSHACRLRLRGRLVALAALLAWSVLAAATTSTTSRLLDAAIMWAMFGEIIAGRDDEC
jgi:hypothetical protein